MSEQRMNQKTNGGSAPKNWGVSAAEFYAALRDLPIQAATLDGKVYKGLLVGVDTYDVIIKQPNGLVVLIAKHAIKFVAADA